MSSHPPPSPSSLQQQYQDLAPSSPFSNSQFGDTAMTKVFVGGLAWETQRDGVRRYFEQFGEILEAVVITDKATGRSKGYGFVTFRDPEGARRACADPTPVIDGRRANCNLASLGVRSRPGTPQQGGRFRGGSPTGGPSPGRASSSPQHMPYSYQQAFPYPPYGYQPYNQQEYIYPSNMVYNGPFIVTPPFTPPFYGGAPPPPSLGSPTAGLYTYQFSPTNQTFQVPFPYPPLGAQMSSQNQPSPSGLLTPDQSPPTSGVGGTGPQHGLAQHHFSGAGAAPNSHPYRPCI